MARIFLPILVQFGGKNGFKKRRECLRRNQRGQVNWDFVLFEQIKLAKNYGGEKFICGNSLVIPFLIRSSLDNGNGPAKQYTAFPFAS